MGFVYTKLGGITHLRLKRQLTIANIVLHRSAVTVVTYSPSVINAHLPELARCAEMSAQQLSLSNNPRPHTRTKREAYNILHTATGTEFPLCQSHTVGIVFHRSRQTRLLLQNATNRHIVPPGHICQRVYNSCGMVYEARQSHSYGPYVRILLSQRAQSLSYSGDHSVRAAALFSLHRLTLCNNFLPTNNGEFNAGSPHVHANARFLLSVHATHSSIRSHGGKEQSN